MSHDLKFQLRLTLRDDYAPVARNHPADPSISSLTNILNRHRAVLRSQFDAFAGYVQEAERNGVADYPLYGWTKKTIEDPEPNISAHLQFMWRAKKCTGETRRTRSKPS